MTEHQFTTPDLRKHRRGLERKISPLLSRKGCQTSYVYNLTLYHTVPTFNDPEIEAF